MIVNGELGLLYVVVLLSGVEVEGEFHFGGEERERDLI